jgi:putative transposase
VDFKKLPLTDKIVGIDLGIKDFIITSEGVKYQNLKSIRNNENKLKKLHRQLSRKIKGSNNRNKARVKLARCHERLKNIKDNYLHKISNELLNDNQVIVVEDLNVKAMMKNHKLAKSIQELSLGDFKTKLMYKANWYNREVIQIDRFYPSSKLCSDCNYKNNDLSLKDREWTCTECGVIHDRDINAATNIRNEGIRILNDNKIPAMRDSKIGCRTAELTLVEIGSSDDCCVSNLKSTLSLKQEIETDECPNLSKFL